MSLLTIGSVAFDAIETPFGKVDKIIGGAASYISIAASYFVKPVNVVAVIGEDFTSKEMEVFHNRSVNTDGINVKKGEKSFFWSGRYHNDMNSRDTLVTEPNVMEDFNPEIPESYQDCEFLMLGNLDPIIQMRALKNLKKRPSLVVLDTMNFWMDTKREYLDEILKEVDILSLNDEEARQLTSEYSLVKAAKKILSLGLKYVVIKKGEHGALLFGKENIFFVPAIPLEEVFDPTGAGDTFAGGFIGYLAKTKDLSFQSIKKAVIHGTTMASFCVEKFGPERLLDLTDLEIKNRYQEVINLTQVEYTV